MYNTLATLGVIVANYNVVKHVFQYIAEVTPEAIIVLVCVIIKIKTF
jgi:hypothetical protein